jgi:excisionase family DNA binding protein
MTTRDRPPHHARRTIKTTKAIPEDNIRAVLAKAGIRIPPRGSPVAKHSAPRTAQPRVSTTAAPPAARRAENKPATRKHKTHLNPQEVAGLLMVSPVTVRQWAANGRLRSVTTPGGHRRFLLADVEAFARNHHRGTAPAPPEAALAVAPGDLIPMLRRTLEAAESLIWAGHDPDSTQPLTALETKVLAAALLARHIKS